MHLVLTGEVVQQTKALLWQHEASRGIPGAQAEVEGEAQLHKVACGHPDIGCGINAHMHLTRTHAHRVV